MWATDDADGQRGEASAAQARASRAQGWGHAQRLRPEEHRRILALSAAGPGPPPLMRSARRARTLTSSGTSRSKRAVEPHLLLSRSIETTL